MPQNNGQLVYGRIYVNGVAKGIERSTSSGAGVTFTEDFALIPNDVVQVYIKTTTSGAAQTSYFKITCSNTFATFS